MPEALEQRYRLLAASFRDGPASNPWRARLPDSWEEALDLLVRVLASDLAQPPREIDREQIGALLGTLLPGRLAGTEAYAPEMADLLEDFLLWTAGEEGLTTQWEWTSALSEHRGAFEAALQDPERPSLGAVRHEPDRRPAEKIGRNDPCPCGSGQKYKQCCLRLG